MSGVFSSTARRLRKGASLPASPKSGDCFVKNSGGSEGQYVCLSDGTWVGPFDTSADSGDVTGAASSTDNALVRFDSTTGKLLQNSLVTSDDSGSVNIPTGQAYKINNVALATGDIGGLQTALDLKAPLAGPTFTGTVTIPTGSQITKPNIIGTATNDNAAAGSEGEYISATLTSGSAITLTTATTANVTSISLTAGDWDVTGTVAYQFGATTSYTILIHGVSTTSITIGSQGTYALILTPATVPTNAADVVWTVPTVRLSLSATTTVYLITQGTFSVSTLKVYGIIRARRVR